MDNHNVLHLQPDDDIDDAAIEAPPVIGGDERRMHVRAYNFWVSLLRGQDFPSIEDLETDTLTDFGPNSVLLDFTGGIDNPTITFLGDRLRAECDLAEDIHAISQVPARTLLSRLTDHYLQIIANRAPVGFEAEYINQRGLETAYRGILLPFSSDHDTIDFIYGVINWKEVVAEEVALGIEGEIDRVLAQAPLQPTQNIPAWADGPSNDTTAPLPLQILADIGQSADESDIADGAALAASDAALADWLAAARDAAGVASSVEHRGRAALYRAIGLAYDFAMIADARPEDYSELLADSGVTAQARAPMTLVVKLVFGANYDKTRLTEFATALSHAKAEGLAPGSLAGYINAYDGGLKGIVCAARSAKRSTISAAPKPDMRRDRARKLEPQAFFAVTGSDEFVVLIARRIDDQHVGVIGVADLDERLIDRALHCMAA